MGEDRIRLKREINFVHATTIMAGIVIGSGIFVSPVSIIKNTGSVGLSLIIWAVSGVLTIFIAISYAELGAMFPRAGGDYAYFKEILGSFPAFLNVWMQFLTIKPCFYAILALTTANYLFYPVFPDCDMPVWATKLFAVWILLSIVIVNSLFVRYVTMTQTFFTVLKVLTLVVIIITGLIVIAKGHTETLERGFEGTTSNVGSIAIALYTGIFTYGGWNYLFNLLEEVKKPEKLVPRVTIFSMLMVIVLYILTNVAYFSVMTPEEMMASPAVAVTFAERTLGKFSIVIPIMVACSAIGALNGAVFGGSRKYFAAARDGLFPEVLATLNTKFLTPWPSIWATSLLAVIYILTGDAVYLIEYLGFVDTFIYMLALACVLYLRWKWPNAKRPITVPIFIPAIALGLMVSAAGLGLYQKPVQNGIGVLIVLSGVPAYFIGVVWKRKPKLISHTMRSFTRLIQKLFLVVPEDRSSGDSEESSVNTEIYDK